MNRTAFQKTLSANDVGSTGGHQAGVLIPKGELDLLSILPQLDPGVKNPSAWLTCIDPDGGINRFRFVYYNNKLHDERGTRNEYRITHMTAWFRNSGATAGDIFEIGIGSGKNHYEIKIIKLEPEVEVGSTSGPVRLRLRGWNRVH
jgi:hypothetical protein